MEKRRLGKSDLHVTPVILGTWALGGWLWGGTEKNESDAAIHAALDSGINTIDTAPVYGFGLSEELVGRAIKGRRREVLVATKCGLVWDDRPGQSAHYDTFDNNGRPVSIGRCLRKTSILRECDMSLGRLGLDEIDLYQCHWPDPGTPLDETMDALVTLRDRGKIRAFGVSNFTVPQMKEGLRYDSLTSLQPRYSLLSREVEADILPFCREQEIGVVAYSPMQRGLLTGTIGMDRAFPQTDARSTAPWFQPENRRRVLEALEQVRPIAEEHGATLAQVAVAWIHLQPGVTAAIVGARNAAQARSNATAGELRLTAEDMAAIRAVFEGLVLDS